MEQDYIIERHSLFSKEEKIKSDKERRARRKRMFLGEIIKEEEPEFSSNNLILAPVGSGKSHLIENMLIPEDFKGDVLYLVSTTSLKDSIAPEDLSLRRERAEQGKSKGFYTTNSRERFGDVGYSVHVMTYHEFGNRILPPQQTFTDKFSIIFCDEIHSVEIYANYRGGSRELFTASRWLFQRHSEKTIYYFTATRNALDETGSSIPGYLDGVEVFNYLNHKNIVKYEARSKYFISNTYQLKNHLEAKVDYITNRGHKGLAFTRRIASQKKIAEIAEIAGYKPISLWSTNNNDEKMSDKQLEVREYVLRTGNIPDPYNLLIINSSMQEGWDLSDEYVEFAILDTLDETEQVQALGRIRKDIDFLILRVNVSDKRLNNILVDEMYINKDLTPEKKDELVNELDIINEHGRQVKWTTIKNLIKDSGYIVEDVVKSIDGERRSVSIISYNKDFKI